MIRIEGIGELKYRPKPAAGRVDGFDWQRIAMDLDQQGNAIMEQLLSPEECRTIAGLYPKDDVFRSRVVMERHGFGRGEYKYFSYPLPGLLCELRRTIYPHLVLVANRWNEAMGIDVRYPEKHADFVERCHTAGHTRPTPLLLQYGVGDYNCLHQDLYEEHVFPLQLAILLSDAGADFTGGEFVMTEQRPRMQSRPMVAPLRQGDGVVFAVHNRPCAWHAQHLSRKPAPRRQPHPVRASLYSRNHFSRCGIRADCKARNGVFRASHKDKFAEQTQFALSHTTTEKGITS